MTTLLPSDVAEPRFPSLASLRIAHAEILKRQREGSETAGLRDGVLAFIRRGQATGALLDEGEDRWEAQSILDYWATFLFRADRTTVDATLADFDPRLAPELADADCPYVGLDAFQEGRSAVFFGRQRMVQSMLDRLAAERFLAVVGSSGSGKSSVVLAGVVAALRRGTLPGSDAWFYPPRLVPGAEPLLSLARALVAAGGEAAAVQAAARLRENPALAVELAAQAGAGRPSVLVVDQFEELFTLCGEGRLCQAFADALSALVQAPGLRHVLLVTLRSDYESQVAQLGGFQELFESAQVRVTPLSAADLRDAIVRPAELVGLKFEDGVVDALVSDILGEPAGLPLLQFTLLKLWENRERNRVTREAYERLGGGRQALARTADELYASLLNEEQLTVRRLLLRLVRSRESLEVLSNRVRRADLDRSEDPGRVDRVLTKLLDARLLRLTPGATPADGLVEVAHEALVRNWPKLVGWLEEEHAEIAVRRRLEALVDEWLRLGKRGGLLDEVQLQEAERWLGSASASVLGYHPELPALVQASREAVTEGKRREEEARRHELEQARQLAAVERRSSRVFRSLAVVAFTLLGLALWSFIHALDSQRKATKAQRKATEAQLRVNQTERAAHDAQVSAQKARLAQQAVALRTETRLREEAEASRQKAEEALLETQKQKEVAEKALKDLQRQKELKEAALEEAAKQSRLAQDALSDVKEQKRLLEEALEKANVATIGAETALKEAQKQRDLAQMALADVLRQKDLLAAETQRAEQALAAYEQAREQVVETRSRNLELVEAPERPTNRVLAKPRELKLDRRERPLRLGASISSLDGGTGSLCCMVKDRTGQRYLLGLSILFRGDAGAPIVQPGRGLDGGDPEGDKVATLARAGKGAKAGAIAKLDPGVVVDPVIPKLGRIRGVESTVRPGDTIRLVGRTSGIVEGKVLRVDDREVVTTILPGAGDAGGPVLSDDGELIGMLYGSDKQSSFVVRIEPILRELGVELVKE